MLRRDLQHCRTRLWPGVLNGNVLFTHVSRERKEGAQEGHAVDIVLPDVETFGAEIDGEGAVVRAVIVQVQRDRFGDVNEGAG